MPLHFWYNAISKLGDCFFAYVCIIWSWRGTVDEIKAFKEWRKRRREELLKSVGLGGLVK